MTRDLRLYTDGTSGPYLIVPLEDLASVEQALRGKDVSFWTDREGIMLDGIPVEAIVNFGRDADVTELRALVGEVQKEMAS